MSSKPRKNTREQTILAIPNTSQESLNLADLPLFLQSKRKPRANTIKLTRDLRDREGNYICDENNARMTQRWIVTGSEEYGIPLACDQRTYIMCIYLLLKRGDINTGKFHFSFYELLKLIGRTDSGQDYLWLNRSLSRLYTVSIFTENIIYDKGQEEYLRVKRFRIFDDMETITARSGQSTNIPLSYGKFNEVILHDIESNYLLTVDIHLFRSLQHHISESLYRILNKRKYKRNSFSIGLHNLANLLTLNVNYAPSQLKRILDKAHQELIEKAFLADVSYSKIRSRRWAVTYTFPTRQVRDQMAQLPRCESGDSSLVQELIKRGVTSASAREITDKYPERVTEKMEAFDWLMRTNSSLIETNPAGYLRKSIEEDWQLPPGFTPKAEQQKKAEKQRKAKLLKELKEVSTDDQTQLLPVLETPKEEISNEELELEVARIKEDKETREREMKAAIQKVLAEMSDEELDVLKEEVLARADDFHKTRSVFGEISQKDMRDWGDKGLTEIYLRGLRDQIIREKYVKGNT